MGTLSVNQNKLQKRLRRLAGEAITDYNMIEDGDKVGVAWSEDEQRVVFEKIVKDTGDDSPDDQAKAGIEEPSEVAENKTDVPKPSGGDEVQSKDDKPAD